LLTSSPSLQLAQLVKDRCKARDEQDFDPTRISYLDASLNELTGFSGLEGCRGLHTLLVPNNKISSLVFVSTLLVLSVPSCISAESKALAL
jgi:hypothetical protein